MLKLPYWILTFLNKKWWLLFKIKKKFPDGTSLRQGWIFRVPSGRIELHRLINMKFSIFFCLLKGIKTEKSNPPSDSEDENGNETKKPSPPPTPLQKIVKSPPSTKQNSKIPSIKCINYIFFFFRKVSQQKNQIRPQIARTRMETKLKSHAHLLRHPKKSWNRRRRQNETAKFRQ